ncbi:amidohydrolase family protein [Pseudomonas aeruginosa]|uniref:amidohydrolase family protein n=1 Tax=Pseudomonas aeruginosa TaxID=287 RepID=UPI0021191088|nr:amidohydrolase family protein [Pseudomonas aeruginosa]MCT5019384.1 amidohydrolase [Pseudomonas aeruginosa]MDH4703202.1 amidohydrolase [Pseudomonas aeruginosa]MDH4716808.1 amidohydrolase [Pseudomonas aeruginosa]MDH4727307.1 amidohydrolase [Pseudomonas aeruginosa]MDI2474974.1 amidohydrolase [Pseudomonas aeruginosa]
MKRRTFVVGAGALVGAGVLASNMKSEPEVGLMKRVDPREDAAAIAAVEKSGVIDVHRHIVPPAMRDLLARRNTRSLAGQELPDWSPESLIASMQAEGVQTAITSAVLPGIQVGEAELTAFSRASNEFSRELAERHKGRIGFFAHLPLPYTAQACTEAIYALDTLKADGVVLMASNDGKFLGDPLFEELMHELNERRAIVFVHPNVPANDPLGLATPLSVIEYPCDITRAGLNLILSGTMERFHKIRWILAHAGGFLPYVAWRASLANTMIEYGDTATQGVLTYLRRFYLDTATSISRSSMATLRELVDPSRLLFGTDAPFASGAQSQQQIRDLVASNFWSAGEASRIERSNALSLFPGYKQPDEAVAALPVFEQESFVSGTKRQVLSPLRSIAQKLRE